MCLSLQKETVIILCNISLIVSNTENTFEGLIIKLGIIIFSYYLKHENLFYDDVNNRTGESLFVC